MEPGSQKPCYPYRWREVKIPYEKSLLGLRGNVFRRDRLLAPIMPFVLLPLVSSAGERKTQMRRCIRP